jgi:hypothetical protein
MCPACIAAAALIAAKAASAGGLAALVKILHSQSDAKKIIPEPKSKENPS